MPTSRTRPNPGDREPITRDRLINAALHEFADRGIDAATLREITDRAQANIAAVNYHFGSKDGLIRSILEHCLGPINEARLRWLDACTHKPSGPATVEELVEALVRPVVENSMDSTGGRAPIRLLLQVRAVPRPLTNTILSEQLDQIHRLFLAAFKKALPDLPPDVVSLRYDFARGAVLQILGDLDPAARDLPDLAVSHTRMDNERVIRHLIRFIADGFRSDAARAAKPNARARTAGRS